MTKRKSKAVARFILREDSWWDAASWMAEPILAAITQFIEAPKGGYPATLTEEEWDAELRKMQAAFAIIATGYWLGDGKQAIIDEGLDAFREWYMGMWD